MIFFKAPSKIWAIIPKRPPEESVLLTSFHWQGNRGQTACPERERENQSGGGINPGPSKAHAGVGPGIQHTPAPMPSRGVVATPPGTHTGLPRPQLPTGLRSITPSPAGAKGGSEHFIHPLQRKRRQQRTITPSTKPSHCIFVSRTLPPNMDGG